MNVAKDGLLLQPSCGFPPAWQAGASDGQVHPPPPPPPCPCKDFWINLTHPCTGSLTISC